MVETGFIAYASLRLFACRGCSPASTTKGIDMLLNDGTQFITRSEFDARLKEPGAPQDYSFEDYLADSLGLDNNNQSAIIDSLIAIIDEVQNES